MRHTFGRLLVLALVAGTTTPPPRAGATALQSCLSEFSGTQDTVGMQPKDFALVENNGEWHLFYTRQYTTPNYSDRTNTRAIGHAVSTDPHLRSWTVVDRGAIRAREGRIWDNLHVWAPTIVKKGATWYMFYTGVQLDTVQTVPQLVTTEIQRIGIATSTDLETWKQDDAPVLFNKMVPWTYQDSTAVGNTGVGWQFRDPYVMPDPDHRGKWLMYYVTIDSTSRKFVVGVATTAAQDLREWKDLWPIRRTSAQFMSADRNESPQVFQRDGQWWLLYMSNHFMANDQVTYTLNASSPSDSAGWSKPDSLKAITCGEHAYPSFLNLLHAIEHVAVGSSEYLGGFSTTTLGVGNILFAQMHPPDSACPNDSLKLDCPNATTGVDLEVADDLPAFALTLAGAAPAHAGASVRLVMRHSAAVHVTVYDVNGRHVRTVWDDVLPAGTTMLAWDGRTNAGAQAGSGVYFVRATGPGGRAVVRLPMLR